MPRVVIAGAGPIGLYTAICLKIHYPDLDVIVLDASIEEYTRPGVIALGALTAINVSLEAMGQAPLSVDDCGAIPPAIYIRDLQAALYERARALEVQLISENYLGLDGNIVQTGLPDVAGVVGTYSACDLLIDCTGNRKFIVKKLFGMTSISDNPIKNHFIAYIDVDTVNDGLLQANRVTPSFESQRKFRAETGWSEFVPPYMDISWRRWSKPRGSPQGTDETNYTAGYLLYFETSELAMADEDRYVPYLEALFRLNTGKDIHFRPDADDSAFNQFMVVPQKLESLVDTTKGFPIIGVGDALISAEYRLGTGVSNGVACANGLMEALRIHSDNIEVIEEQWRFKVLRVFTHHEKDITDLYSDARIAMDAAANEAYVRYSVSEEEGVEVANDMSCLANKFCRIAEDKSQLGQIGIVELMHAAHMYERSYVLNPNEHTYQRLNELATLLKNTGNDAKIPPIDRIKLYTCALNLHDKYVPNAWEEKTKIRTNLGRVCFRVRDFANSSKYFEQAHNMVELPLSNRTTSQPIVI